MTMTLQFQQRLAHAPLAAAPHPLRVCLIMSADLWAGAEVQVATTASYLVERPDVKLTAVLFNDGWLARELVRLGIDVAIVDEQRHNSLQIVTFLAQFLREHEIDLVHTHRFKDNVLGSAAAKLAGVPHVIRTVHGLPEPTSGWDRARCLVYDALDKLALWSCADRIVAVSRRTAEALKQSGYKRSAVTTIHNGVDFGSVRATRTSNAVRRALGIDPGAFLVGTAGRLVSGQGPRVPHWGGRANRRSGAARSRPVHRQRTARGRAASACAHARRRSRMSLRRSRRRSAGERVRPCRRARRVRPAVAFRRHPYGAPRSDGAREAGRGDGGGRRPGDHRGSRDRPACRAAQRTRARDGVPRAGAQQRLGEDARRARTPNGRKRFLARPKRTGADRALSRRRAPPHEEGRSRGAGAIASAPVRLVLSRIRRKAARALERRRAQRLRQNPAEAAATLVAARDILVVCHGNIIRSPFAARLIAQALGDRVGVSIASAGLEAEPGRPSHPLAIEAARPLLIDLRNHEATRLTPESVARADAIFVMDVEQLLAIRRSHPTRIPQDISAHVSRAGDTARSSRSRGRRRASLSRMLRAHFPRGPATGTDSRERDAMRREVKTALGHLMFASRLDAVLLGRAAVIVAFHRVHGGEDARGLSISPDMFERHCRFFSRHFRVIALADLVKKLERGESLNRHLAITFDDGYRDNFENALPVLEKLSLPATFFVVSQWIGSEAWPWWDREQGVRHPWMTWDQVRELQSARVRHRRPHPDARRPRPGHRHCRERGDSRRAARARAAARQARRSLCVPHTADQETWPRRTGSL